MKNTFTFLVLFVSSFKSFAQSPTPFTCQPYFYQSRQVSAGGTDGGATMAKETFGASPTSVSVVANKGAGFTFNALGYNMVDNFIYGAANISNANSNKIFRIGANGDVSKITITSGLPINKAYNAGDVDEDGFYYVKASGSNGTIYKINISTQTATTITMSGAASALTISDFSIAKKDALGDVYAYTVPDGTAANPRLYKIKLSGPGAPAVGTVTNVGSTATTFSGYAPGGPYFGGQFIDNSNNFFVFENGNPGTTQGKLYKINITTGAATFVQNLPASERNDGAYCRAAQANVLLPVTWGTIKASTQDNNTFLTWETFAEINTLEYIVEVSKDGTNFTAVQKVNAKGTTSNRSVYSYTHYNAFYYGTKLFYRLKQTDLDGKFSYSSVVSVSFHVDISDKITAYPVPCNRGHILTISAPTAKSYRLYAMDSKMNQSGIINSIGNTEISTKNLSPGFYIIVTDDNHSKKISIQ